MYRQNKMSKTNIRLHKTREGETIEAKVRRITLNNEPIKDGAPIIYTDRKEGVLPAYDIRTDRFDIALDAQDIVNKSKQAKREGNTELGKVAKKNMETETSGQSTQGTEK